MRWLLAFSILFSSLAALDVDVSGQYENSFYPQMYDTKMKMMDMNKLRLDMSGKIDDNIDFQANYNIQLYHGKTMYHLADYIPRDVLDDYLSKMGVPQDTLDQQVFYEYEDRYYLDNANLTLYWKEFDLRVGKQLIPWGTGYSRNPTDCFHRKNILDPTYDKEGVNAVKLDYNLNLATTLTAIMSVDEDWETSKRAARIRSRLLDYDFSLSYVRFEQDRIDYATHEAIGIVLDQFGADISGQLLGLGVWAEGAYRQSDDLDDYGQILGGMDFTFENGLYLMGEYYYNESGESTSDDYTFDDWTNLLEGVTESLGKHYGFAMIQYPLTEIVNGSLYTLYNASDGSAMLYPWIDFTLGDNIETDIVLYLPIGRDNSEYGTPDTGGMIRLRVYF